MTNPADDIALDTVTTAKWEPAGGGWTLLATVAMPGGERLWVGPVGWVEPADTAYTWRALTPARDQGRSATLTEAKAAVASSLASPVPAAG